MEKFKYGLFLAIFLAFVALIGYWAFFTLEPGSLHAEKQKQEELTKENEELRKEIESLKSEIRMLTYAEEPLPTPQAEEEPAQTETPASTTYKNQTLINEVQKLISDNVVMKEGSKGTRVGTVQRFLNLYNNTSKRIDNDFGPGTKTDIINFQKAEKITADGEAGPGTFQKMVDWLKKQG